MAVASGNSVPTIAPFTAATKTSGSWTISGSNLVILLYIALNSATATVLGGGSKPTWSLGDGGAVEVKNVRTTDCFVSVWAIPAPTAGTGTFTFNNSASVATQVGADCFTGADQTTPCPAADAVSASVTQSSTQTLTQTPSNLTASDGSAGGQANTVAGDVTSVSPHQTFLDDTSTINLEAGYNLGTTGPTYTTTWMAGGGAMNCSTVTARIVAVAAAASAALTGRRALLGVGR